MKETLTVKHEGKPVRCEVCHQTDKFNPATGVCRRCNEAFDEPVGLMPWFAIGHWNVPEIFHEEFLEAAKRERVFWVGRPVRQLAEEKINIFEAVIWPILIIGCFLGMIFMRSNVAFITSFIFLFLFICLARNAVLNFRRIDQTLYMLTEGRALVVYADRSAPTKEFPVKHDVLRRKMVDKRKDVGHLIFGELDKLPPGERSSRAWDEPVRMTLLKNFYPRGFFFIENVSDVEQLVHDHIPRRESDQTPFHE